MTTVNVRKETGKLYIDFRHLGVRCREQTAMKDSLTNRRKLKALINKMDASMTLGCFDYAEIFPNSKKAKLFSNVVSNTANAKRFDTFSKEWVTEMSPSWRSSYRQTVIYLVDKKLNNKFGGCYLYEISKADILKFRSELMGTSDSNAIHFKSKPSASYVNRIIGILCAILNEAADRFGFCRPTLDIKRLTVRKQMVVPFSLNEVSQIIKGSPKNFKDYFIIRFFSGLRTGELHGLRWKNVHFDDKQIIINESIINGVVGITKSQSSDRVIHMTDILYSALKRLKRLSETSEFVFNKKGKPLTQSYITQSIWYPLLVKLNINKRRPYNSRHTCATLWLASGENPEWIARQLGHQSTQILFDIYSNYVPNLTRQDGREANKLFNQLEVNL